MTFRQVSRQEQLRVGQLDIIDALYSAVTDPLRWNDVVSTTSGLFGGGISALLHLTGGPQGGQQLLAADFDPAFARSYAEHYGQLNLWAFCPQRENRSVHFGDDTVPAQELERSEFYSDWLLPQNVRYTFCARIPLGPNETLELATIRPRGCGPINQTEAETINVLLPHLKRALLLSQRMMVSEVGQAASVTAFKRMGTGLLLVDSHRRVVFIDPEAEQMLSGTGLTIRNGQLRAAPIADAELGEAIARATGGGRVITGRSGSLLTVPRPGDNLRLSVAIGPVDERDRPLGLVGPLAMVLITDPARGRLPSEDGLRALFDLTPAEAKLVTALCTGETLAGYATSSGTSLNTVKTHLKRAFDKTGETRQSDLVRRVSNDVALRFGAGSSL